MTVLERAFDALIAQCEQRKFAATERPATPSKAGPVKRGRHIPAHVRRVVWKRDQGRCTYVAPTGQLCGSRSYLEFDHILPVAKGGASTVENVRMRCRQHNDEAARLAFGPAFMRKKRVEAALRAREVATPEPAAFERERFP